QKQREFTKEKERNIRNISNKKKPKKNTVSFSKKLEKLTVSDSSIELKAQRTYKKRKEEMLEMFL
ncbi:hypothetical protein C1645_792887, partial [Glomus cerebriforme]